jgi:hypothetical protein
MSAFDSAAASSGRPSVGPETIKLIHGRAVRIDACRPIRAAMFMRIVKDQWAMCPRRTLCAGALVETIGERHAKLTKHVRLAVYYDSCTREVHVTIGPAPKAKSPICAGSSTSTFALLHVVGELFKATETGAATAGE